MMSFRLFLFLLLNSAYGLMAQNVCLDNSWNGNKVHRTQSVLTGSSSFTIEFIIKTSTYSDNIIGGNPMTILDLNNTGNNTDKLNLRLIGMNKLAVIVNGSYILRTNNQVADMNWHHVAVVYDSGNARPYRIYLDGSLDTFGTGPKINLSSGNSMTIFNDLNLIEEVEGILDEFRVFNHARSDSAIIADMNREYCDVSGKGLIAYYKFNEGFPGQDNRSIVSIVDFSGNANHCSITGFALRGNFNNYKYGINLNGGNTRDTISAFDCDTVYSPSGRYRWSKTGNYGDTLENFEGCDSIILVKVKIGSSVMAVDVSACDSFVSPLNQIIKSNGIHTEIYSSYTSCDSTVNYNITIRNSKLSIIQTETCDSFVSQSGKVYFSSGTYNEVFKTWYGCDSTIRYTIKINFPKSSYEFMTVCDSVNIKGTWYKSSGNPYFRYTSFKGCDSVHVVFLTVKKSTSKTVKVVACDSFVSPKGIVYKIDGLYKETYQSYNACDSVVTFDVHINRSKKGNTSMKVCRGLNINGVWHDSSRLVTYFGKTYLGCDSIVDIQLEVTKIDTIVSKSNNTLTAVQDSAIYQWINCDNQSFIPNETGRTFTTAFDGDYAVIIQWKGCKDTSQCHQIRKSGLNGPNSSQKPSIHPNPNFGQFSLILPGEGNARVNIYDLSGRILNTFETDSEIVLIEDKLGAGTYFIECIKNGLSSRVILLVE